MVTTEGRHPVIHLSRKAEFARGLGLSREALRHPRRYQAWLERVEGGAKEEICSLTVRLDRYTTGAAETLSPKELVAEAGRIRTALALALEGVPCAVPVARGPVLQVLFSQALSGTDYRAVAVGAARTLMGVVASTPCSGRSFPLLELALGVAGGSAVVGVMDLEGSWEILVAGQPVALASLLASERDRLGMPLLLDETCGREGGAGVRPLDCYRLGGGIGFHTLYGLSGDSSPEVPGFAQAFHKGLELLYGPGDHRLAEPHFLECLRASPGETAASRMLEAVRNPQSPKPRAYRAS